MEYITYFMLGIISAILSVTLYYIYKTYHNEQIEQHNLLPIGVLGYILGIINVFSINILSSKSMTLDQDILTGSPDF